jgi:hypothetical protein
MWGRTWNKKQADIRAVCVALFLHESGLFLLERKTKKLARQWHNEQKRSWEDAFGMGR